MIGRAGRRGLDETGFVLAAAARRGCGGRSRCGSGATAPLPWAFMLRQLRAGRARPRWPVRRRAVSSHWSRSCSAWRRRRAAEPPSCLVVSARILAEPAWCAGEKNPSSPARSCVLRDECLASAAATLLWQWQRLGLLDRSLLLRPRGEKSFRSFSDRKDWRLPPRSMMSAIPLDELVFDWRQSFRWRPVFPGTNPRTLGRLARVCEQTYRRFTAEGWLDHGLPPQYGCGAEEIVRALVEQKARRGELAAASESAGRGDIDRLLTEWRSLLRIVVHALRWCFWGRRPPPGACSRCAGTIFGALCRTQLG